jgi:hypothetical protein
VSRLEHIKAMGANPCPVCYKGHDGPEDHFCEDCITPQREHTPTKPQPRSVVGGRVYRSDGHGCVERIHPTELKLEAGDRGEEW